jgi:hypothetical protein
LRQAAGGAEEETGEPAEGQAGHCRPHQQGARPAAPQQEEVGPPTHHSYQSFN